MIDRLVAAVPADGPGWIDQLELLTSQLTGSDPVADHHLDHLATALRTALAAVDARSELRNADLGAWEHF